MTKNGWKTAKKIRVVFSLSFTVLISIIFLDPWHIVPKELSVCLTSVEIIPVFLKLFVAGGLPAVIGFGVVALTTILFGRIYCSTICPVGTVQDISIHFSKKINRRKRFKYYKPPHWLQYIIFAVGSIAALFGSSMIVGDLLEPFSNYGRLLTNFALLPLLFVNNLLAAILTHFEIYFFYDIPLHFAETGMLLFTSIFFVTVIYLSAAKGRLFCNSFCPAGAFLSLISRISFFKLAIKDNLCNDCGACDKVCKAECIDSIEKRIDFSACVGCFNCLRSCPKNAIEYLPEVPFRKRKALSVVPREKITMDHPDVVLQSRRELLRNVGIPAAALLLVPGVVGSGMAFANKRRVASPPGSLSVMRFTSLCTACHLCVSSCPTNVLRPSFLEYGIAGMSQPMMDYKAGYCNYDCVICGDVCPNGAILERSVAEKKRIQIGKAKFNNKDCIVVSKKKDCAACSEHCPTKAVHTVPYEANLLLPEVDDEICIGCGACEHVCPATPKAIIVDANIIHLKAKQPKKQETQPKVSNPINDFPF